MNTKVLVTGSSGFLGTALCSKLESLEYDVVKLNSKNADLTKDYSLEKFNEIEFDYIFHLAAWTQAGDFCLYHQGEQWIINQKINTNVLSWWQKCQPQAKIITMGTSCSYAVGIDLKEENYLKGEPIESLYTYGMTKRMMQIGLQSIEKQFGLNWLTAVPSTLYGPDYHTDGRQMHFIFDLIRKIVQGKFFGSPVELWGDGNQKRELVYVYDFVDQLVWLTKNINNEIVNIGAGEEFSIRRFAEIICEKVGYDFDKITFDTSRYVGAKSKCLSIDKIKKLTTNYSLTSLEYGLDSTIDWFIKHKELLIKDGQ